MRKPLPGGASAVVEIASVPHERSGVQVIPVVVVALATGDEPVAVLADVPVDVDAVGLAERSVATKENEGKRTQSPGQAGADRQAALHLVARVASKPRCSGINTVS